MKGNHEPGQLAFEAFNRSWTLNWSALSRADRYSWAATERAIERAVLDVAARICEGHRLADASDPQAEAHNHACDEIATALRARIGT